MDVLYGYIIRRTGLADCLIVLCVGPDPEPEHAVGNRPAHSAVPQADTDGPELAGLLEVKRRMPGIGLEPGKCSIGSLFYRRRKTLIAHPERLPGIPLKVSDPRRC